MSPVRWLFGRPEEPRNPFQVILWWELRRIPYNLIVGGAGTISLLLFYFFIVHSHVLRPGEDAVEPMALIIAPFVINILYTGGWVVELVIYLFLRRATRIGPILLAVGTAFSLCVIAVPGVVWGLFWLVHLIRH